METPDLTTVESGEVVTLKLGTSTWLMAMLGVKAGERVATVTVLPVCQGTRGQWLCVRHPGANTTTNWTKDSHISEGRRHRLGWLCYEHGLEAPTASERE